jgi:hypothetical protein
VFARATAEAAARAASVSAPSRAAAAAAAAASAAAAAAAEGDAPGPLFSFFSELESVSLVGDGFATAPPSFRGGSRAGDHLGSATNPGGGASRERPFRALSSAARYARTSRARVVFSVIRFSASGRVGAGPAGPARREETRPGVEGVIVTSTAVPARVPKPVPTDPGPRAARASASRSFRSNVACTAARFRSRGVSAAFASAGTPSSASPGERSAASRSGAT